MNTATQRNTHADIAPAGARRLRLLARTGRGKCLVSDGRRAGFFERGVRRPFEQWSEETKERLLRSLARHVESKGQISHAEALNRAKAIEADAAGRMVDIGAGEIDLYPCEPDWMHDDDAWAHCSCCDVPFVDCLHSQHA